MATYTLYADNAQYNESALLYGPGFTSGSTTWEAEHDGATGFVFEAVNVFYNDARVVSGPLYQIKRMRLHFDPAAIGAGETIISAVLSLYLSIITQNLGDQGVHIVSGVDMDPVNAVAADYGALLNKTTPFASMLYSAMTLNAYNAMTLSADAIAELNGYLAAGQWLRLGVRPTLDLENIPAIDGVREHRGQFGGDSSTHPPMLVLVTTPAVKGRSQALFIG